MLLLRSLWEAWVWKKLVFSSPSMARRILLRWHQYLIFFRDGKFQGLDSKGAKTSLRGVKWSFFLEEVDSINDGFAILFPLGMMPNPACPLLA
jgi:hypothetical protein